MELDFPCREASLQYTVAPMSACGEGFCCLLQLLPECKYKLTVVEFLVGEEMFEWSGSTLVSPGYTAVYTWQALLEDEAPSIKWEKGQRWNVEQVSLRVVHGGF